MTRTLEIKSLPRNACKDKIKKEELLRLMKVLDVNSRPRRGIRGSGRAAGAAPRKPVSGTRLSQANLILLREYFAICVALRREYNGVEGV